MKKLVFTLGIFLLLLTVINSCKKVDGHKPIDSDGIPPAAVSNVVVTNFAGGATLEYTLPKDQDLQYVVARYTVNATTQREAKASYHNNQLTVEGFGAAGEYSVKLFAVDRSGNESEPVAVAVHPETPAYIRVFESLDLIRTFGGASTTFENVTEANIGLVILTENNNGELVPVDALYTSQQNGSFTVRGYDTVPRIFGIYVRDRWDNVSDTLIRTLKPLFEKPLDRTKFAEYQLPDDAPKAFESAGYTPAKAWDGIIDGFAWHTANAGVILPLQITFDLGVVAQLSRVKLWDRKGYEFTTHSLRKFAIWGRETLTQEPGYDGWTKLVDCESIKPSGLPLGQANADDLAAAAAGMEYDIPSDAPQVRYIRIQMFENWSGGVAVNIGEMAFWGDY